jgi:RNA-directed DNA polymerase
MRQIMTRLQLTVNEEKTHVRRLPTEHFEFLGYSFGRCYSTQTGRAYLGTRPSKKSIRRLIRNVREQTDRKNGLLDAEVVVARLNRALRGWANYFRLGPVSKAYAAIDTYTMRRLHRWLCSKPKVHSSGSARFSAEYITQGLGLVRLSRLTHNLPWATA